MTSSVYSTWTADDACFLIAEGAEAGVEDYSGYWNGEAILGRLFFA